MMLLVALIGIVIQLLIFTAIPFLVFVIRKKTTAGFWVYIGLKQCSWKSIFLGLLLGIGMFAVMMLLAYSIPDFYNLIVHEKSVAGKFSLLEPGFKTVMLVLLTALVKTALTEEILFRGFIAKRCISLLGFTYGNALQAFIFGGLHFLLFMALSNSLLLPFFIFLVSGTSSYLKVVLNEKNANGSILPGWSAHAVANLSMYLTALFIL